MTDYPATTSRYCANCGTPIPPGSNFCPSCGKEVVRAERVVAAAGDKAGAVAPPVRPGIPISSAIAEPRSASLAAAASGSGSPAPSSPLRFWLFGVPITLVIVGLLAWAVLAGLPFGERDRSVGKPSREIARVSEGSVSTATVSKIEVPAGESNQSMPAVGPSIVENGNRVAPSRKPASRDSGKVPAKAAPPTTEPSGRGREGGEMSEESALERLDSLLASRNPYRISSDCYSTRSLGYSNRGYTIEVRSRSCSEDASRSGSLGRWRVDSLTGEVFRQNSSGRYVRP